MGKKPTPEGNDNIPVLQDRYQGEAPKPTAPTRNTGRKTGRGSTGKPPQKRIRWLRLLFWFLVMVILIVLAGIAVAAYLEAKTSKAQARWIPPYARTLTYQLQDGPTNQVLYPDYGPFDARLGYVRLPEMLAKVQSRGLEIEQQAVFSRDLIEYVEFGLFPPFQEKTQAGLSLYDCRNEQVYQYIYPRRVYTDFESIPPRISTALLFIENRDLLNNVEPFHNPAVDWGRFLKAVLVKVGEAIGLHSNAMGGSTLATQIEKYRHSPDGVTGSISEKLRQMASATIRIYQQGPVTFAERKRLVLDYLNTVPLSAAQGYGEVNGLGDGLYVWFASDFQHVNNLLRQPDGGPDGDAAVLKKQGEALKQVVALMIAHRRPSYYLGQDHEELTRLSNSYIRLLANHGLISPALRDVAVAKALVFRNAQKNPAVIPMETNKGINVIRNRLTPMLGVSLYDLDRIDVSANSSLQIELQDKITAHLHTLADEKTAQSLGLVGEYLLKPGQAKHVKYSFTLFERTPTGNRVRVQTDNTDQPFDINEGSKLELGSTAKLRVLSTYLEIMAELYERHVGQSPDSWATLRGESRDNLTRFVMDELLTQPELSLPDLLQHALDRSYSASPGEQFYTGGGIHTFNNFKKEDNGRVPTVREALQESINLPFVRMLRDIVNYTTQQKWQDSNLILADESDPRRKQMLSNFIDRESVVFLSRFWKKYRNKNTEERLEKFLTDLRPGVVRYAVIHRYLFPQADQKAFGAFLQAQLPDPKRSAKEVAALYQRYAPGAFNLQDMGYLARVHPLELWLLGYLQHQPDKVRFDDAVAASKEERQSIYNWLIRTRHKNARDSRIRTMLEVEAFTDIHRRWKSLGYAFDHLVPSLATALGSSGDRPAALAELMGIILNDGVRQPTVRIEHLGFAAGTPYETQLGQSEKAGRQVMHPEVAKALRKALAEVVNDGTARRLQGAYHGADGAPLVMGGKTGTGDNRLVVSGVKGRALSRTATFVFYLGDRYFGTLTAFVPGKEASTFRFTSALPVQTLKGMASVLEPYLMREDMCVLEEVEAIPANLEDTSNITDNSDLDQSIDTVPAYD